jgi:hypothetical protein
MTTAYNPWGLTGDAQNHFDPLWGMVDPASGGTDHRVGRIQSGKTRVDPRGLGARSAEFRVRVEAGG